jgi:hypothetical protein
MWTFKRVAGSIAAVVTAVLALLSAGTRDELLTRLKDWLTLIGGFLGGVLAYFSFSGVLLFLGICIGLWAWDVPQRAVAKLRGDPNDPQVLLEARKKRVRAQVGDFLRIVFSNTARHAVGGLFQQTEVVVHGLRHPPTDALKQMSAGLLVEYMVLLQESLQPVLTAQGCHTDDEFVEYQRTWGELFFRYQRLAHYVNEAYKVCAERPWQRIDYDEWRQKDALFITSMREAEHMEGCQHLAVKIKDAGWGDEDRPPDPPRVKD